MTEVYCLFRELGMEDGDVLIGVYMSIEEAKNTRPECTWELARERPDFRPIQNLWVGAWERPLPMFSPEWRYYFIQPFTIGKYCAPENELDNC